MFFLPLGVVSLIAGLGLFGYTQSSGGSDATETISGHVLTGTMLYGIAGLLAIAGVLFIISALIKAVRRAAALVAIIALLSGGGIGTFLPQSETDFLQDKCMSSIGAVSTTAHMCAKYISGK